ncbi:MAG: hypothetical protein PHP45_05030 [Elusimicrobiales bacterium]|nr:hypothetical protein [Elusimicrobiales bacterium]
MSTLLTTDYYPFGPNTDAANWEDDLAEFLGITPAQVSKEFRDRYLEIHDASNFIVSIPWHKKISERITKPIRIAIKNYCRGDDLASIVLCGLAAETLTIIVWRTHEVQIAGKTISLKEEKILFGDKFEKLEQEKRIKILSTLNLITPVQDVLFNKIKKTRNEYIHPAENQTKQELEDARALLKQILSLLKSLSNELNKFSNSDIRPESELRTCMAYLHAAGKL